MFKNFTELKAANKRIRGHWFTHAHNIGTKCETRICKMGFFVTSEPGHLDRDARRFTVRRASLSGHIHTVGNVGEYTSRKAAMEAAKDFRKNGH